MSVESRPPDRAPSGQPTRRGARGDAAGRVVGSVEFCGLRLVHPIVNASGTFDLLAAAAAFGEDALRAGFPFAAFVSKTITVHPRAGNPPPRLWEAAAGLVNSIGLPNKGLDAHLAEELPLIARLLAGARTPAGAAGSPGVTGARSADGGSHDPQHAGLRQADSRRSGSQQPGAQQPGSRQPGSRQPGSRQPGSQQPGLRPAGSRQTGAQQSPIPLITNVMGATAAEIATLLERCDARPEIAALELNVSCPNVTTGLDIGADPRVLEAVLREVRPATAKPLIVKLTPNTASVADCARAAQAGGADAVSLINTLRAMALVPEPAPPASDPVAGLPEYPIRTPWLGGGTGGLSGPAIRAVALAQVAAVAQAVSIPIVGMGGVQNARHARDLLDAGATLVAVGTESFRDPAAGARIACALDTQDDAMLAEQPAAGLRKTPANPLPDRPPVST